MKKLQILKGCKHRSKLCRCKCKNVFLSSEGANASKNESKVALFINAVASDGKTLQFSSDRIGNVGGFEIIKQADLEKLGRKVGKML